MRRDLRGRFAQSAENARRLQDADSARDEQNNNAQ